MLKSLSEKKFSYPFVFVFSFLNTVILFPLQFQIPGMSWHQTHVKQINTFLHTLTSAAISLLAQLALHLGNSFGAGCYCRRTTLNQQHLLDSPVFTLWEWLLYFYLVSQVLCPKIWAATQNNTVCLYVFCMTHCHGNFSSGHSTPYGL